VCATIFLDVALAFDKVWHKRLFHKLNMLLAHQYSQLLENPIYQTDVSE
jgi:hypothetical protein